ncbi:MAG: pyridoxal phosphate-dependent aminotransferase [Candidatus Cloacimonetes bacterium]|nr:pyridoxal phosphate-dependent aminotransferase [Candidatus Cloacimonadota bacterium]
MPSLTEARRLRGIELSLIRQVIQAAPPDAINLALGELGFPLPPALRQKALELLQEETPVYTPNAGLPNLREAIAGSYPGSDPDRVCVCNGVEEALFVSLLAMLDPRDTLAIPDPDYPAYSAIGKMLECNIIRLPFESDLSSVDWELWSRLLNSGVKALVLSHPGNPGGFVFSPEEAQRLAAICNSAGITLIVDEIYARLVFQGTVPSFRGRVDRLFILGGLSKSHCLSGWRIGWVLAPAELASAVVKARQYVSTCSNWLSQQLAVFALSPAGLASADEVLAQLKACRKLALAILATPAPDLLAPAATPYLMLRVGGDDLRICQDLAGKGVICVPGSAFGQRSQGWLRLNYALPQDKLKTALDILNNELYLH